MNAARLPLSHVLHGCHGMFVFAGSGTGTTNSSLRVRRLTKLSIT